MTTLSGRAFFRQIDNYVRNQTDIYDDAQSSACNLPFIPNSGSFSGSVLFYFIFFNFLILKK